MNKSVHGLAPVRQEAAPLRRKITSALRRAIETGALAPGSRLVEKDLCADLDVSRTSLRESLRELEAEGLVTNGSKGLVVTAISPREARNIYAVRGVLEGLLMEQFAREADDAAMARLDAAVTELAAAYEAGEIERIIASKADFYEVLCTGADNMIVLELLSRLNTRINRLRFASLSQPLRAKASIAEIFALAAALRRRDGAEARRIALAHIDAAACAALGAVQIHPPAEEATP
ncbi:GntR family transcriptional regulator [Xanthobacter sp. KR7-225]|uniref:GntR family transcriptional regulator n=1 Tax=Xanthobacter sp. KR7-225 TaxID=3156613 RepID=UPI0032B3170D